MDEVDEIYSFFLVLLPYTTFLRTPESVLGSCFTRRLLVTFELLEVSEVLGGLVEGGESLVSRRTYRRGSRTWTGGVDVGVERPKSRVEVASGTCLSCRVHEFSLWVNQERVTVRSDR